MKTDLSLKMAVFLSSEVKSVRLVNFVKSQISSRHVPLPNRLSDPIGHDMFRGVCAMDGGSDLSLLAQASGAQAIGRI
ncbi:hypothetical protein ACFSM5_19430, partial [Lacibacterium aquatile]